MIAIELPWPSVDLSPNARMNPFAHAKAKKAAKNAAWGFTKAVMSARGIPIGSFVGPVKVTYTFHPAIDRARDDDNFAARMKASRDGIALALGVDDRHFKQQPVVFGEKRKPACVVVVLEPAAVNLSLKGVIS